MAPLSRSWILLVALPLAAAPPGFSPAEAVRAAWERQPLAQRPEPEIAADRARLALTRARIGAPGDPPLLPPELDKPSEARWRDKAKVARTPQERVNALFFLNRLKSPHALEALAGLTAGDAASWPRALQLTPYVTTARLQGAELSPELQGFLNALERAGKVEPVRAHAAWLRLKLAGNTQETPPPLAPTPHAVLALMDAWNSQPWSQRAESHRIWLAALDPRQPSLKSLQAPFRALNLALPKDPTQAGPLTHALLHRLFEGTAADATVKPMDGLRDIPVPALRRAYLDALGRAQPVPVDALRAWLEDPNLSVRAAVLPALRKAAPLQADRVRDTWLLGDSSLLRATALGDLPEPPPHLEALVRTVEKDREVDSLQELLAAFERWKLPSARRADLLRPFLQHADWGVRFLAHQALKAWDPQTPWPTAPAADREAEIQLKFAQRLASEKRPVRVRVRFQEAGTILLKLDPGNAPLNVANFIRLARKGAFHGRQVGRVVPNFVIQTGSPFDTMDGGSDSTVRCENSLQDYTPGSVGMALSGKDTGGCQWFITLNATPHLTGRYTRLGEVEDPLHALALLERLSVGAKIARVEVLR